MRTNGLTGHTKPNRGVGNRAFRCAGLLTMIFILGTAAVFGQSVDSIANALLRIRSLSGNVSTINGQLYAGSIDAQIIHSGSVDEITGNDLFSLNVFDPTGKISKPVTCGTRQLQQSKSQFDACVKSNIQELVQILFPASLSSSVTGRDAAQNYSQLFLLNTALGIAAPNRKEETPRREAIGGLAEHEWFSGSNLSGHAWQGLYQLEKAPVSLYGAYVNQEDAVRTKSATFGADYHPSLKLHSSPDWRIGFDARSGFLYSRSSPLTGSGGDGPLPLGSVDFGGGVWSSAHKDFSRVRIGAASLLQASKSHTPSFGNREFAFVVDAMNSRPIAYDASYGAVIGFLTSDRTSINGRFLETRPIFSDSAWPRPTSRLAMASFSYLLGGVTPLDFGYKVTTRGDVLAHSVFVQGNFRW